MKNMVMKDRDKIITIFVNGYYDNNKYEGFDLENTSYSNDYLEKEFIQFCCFLNYFYYEKGKLVSVVNFFEDIDWLRQIEHLIYLKNKLEKKGLYDAKHLIDDFLLTYYKTYIYNRNTSNKTAIDKISDIDICSLENECEKFYMQVIKYSYINNKTISRGVLDKILNNITKKNKKVFVEELVKSDNYHINVIDNDNNKKEHKDYYLKYIVMMINNIYINKEVINIIKKMFNFFDKSEKNIIINEFVKKVNSFCERYKDKKERLVNFLSILEQLRTSLNELSLINNLDKEQRSKLQECIIKLLNLKRFLLSDISYVSEGMVENTSHVDISTSKINNFCKEIENNNKKIYAYSKLDFDGLVKETIDNQHTFLFNNLFNHYEIDTDNQVYYNRSNMRNNNNLSFKEYYDLVGKKYDYKKQHNKVKMNYYEDMLHELSRIFRLQQELIINFLKKDGLFEKVIENFKIELGYCGLNDYQIIVKNILAIEIEILELMDKNNLPFSKRMEENLSKLFKLYKNDKEIRDGLMYIYYCLYEYSGPRLRNGFMHGSFIGRKTYDIPLLISFSCLIFISYLTYGNF